jgi:cell wall-associated NlpC family hydrolase
VFDLSAETPNRVAEFMAGDESSRAGVDVAAVTGTWIDGRVAASAAAGAGGVVRLYALDGDGGATLDSTVAVAGQPGNRLTVAGGGFVYPDVPVLAVAAVGGQTATVVGVQATGDFLTWDEFNTTVVGPGAAAIASAPADPDALAVLPALGIDPGTFTTVDLAPKGGTAKDEQTVVTGFAKLGMVPAPARNYKSPYTLAAVAPDLTRDFAVGDRADPAKWVGESTGAKDKYGPLATVFPVDEWVTALTPLQQAERLIAAAAKLIGTPYEHHHAPTWLPDLDRPWVPAPVSLKQTPGTDCSNFTGFLYNYALGIQINTDVEKVATETSGKQKVKRADGSVETRDVSIVVTDAPHTRDEAAYQKLMDELQPGDLLHIAGTSPITGKKAPQDNPPKAAHAIMWLGWLATGPDGDPTPLIVDCTGPEHTDADGIHPPMGVHVRPFGLIGANSWYFQDLISYSRILPPIPTP